MALEVRTEFVQCRPAGVAVDHDPVAGRAPEQLVHGSPAVLPLMSHSATSTAAMAVIVTGPRRQ